MSRSTLIRIGVLMLMVGISRIGVCFSRVSLLPAQEVEEQMEAVVTEKAKSEIQEKPQIVRRASVKANGNLPSVYLVSQRKASLSENPIILPGDRTGLSLDDLKPGDIVEATIYESVFAYANSKAPVRAIVTKGPLKGSVFIGECNLENNSKRTLISFTQFRHTKREHVYKLNASGLDTSGVLGVKGEVFSNEALFFGGELLSAGAAGFTDSTIDRSQNLLGNYVEAPSLANSTKRAVAQALSKSTERFSEKLKNIPEYSILNGPIDIKIIVTQETSKN